MEIAMGAVEAINVLVVLAYTLHALNIYDATGTTIATMSANQLLPNFTNLPVVYSITVSDSWNCDVKTPIVEIREPDNQFCSNKRNKLVPMMLGCNYSDRRYTTYEYSEDNVSFTAPSTL